MRTFLLLLAAATASAQDKSTPIDPAAGLSEADAVTLALARNPSLAALRHSRIVAEATVSRASMLANPELKFGISDLVSEIGNVDRARNNVGLRWAPPRLSEIGLRSAAARAGVRESEAEIRAAENRLAAEVRVLHRTAALLDEQVRLAEETLRVREQVVAFVHEQVAAGLKSALEEASADLSLAELRPLVEQYRADRTVQLLRLSQKIGVPASTIRLRVAAEPYAFTPPTLDRAALLEQALANRQELAASTARCDAANLNLTAARRELYPWISFVQLLRRSDQNAAAGNWGFQVGLELPVFRWRHGILSLPMAQLNQCQARSQAVKASITAEVDEVLTRLEGVAAQLTAARSAISTQSERMVTLAKAQLTAGESDKVEPLLASLRLIASKQAFLTRLMEFHALVIGLDQAIGKTG